MAMPYVIFTDLETGQAFNSFYSYGLILSQQEIGVPPVKTNTINIEGAQGSLDMTEAFDEIFYKDRTLTFTFSVVTDMFGWDAIRTKIGNDLHGRKIKIQIYSDMGKHYIGRCFVDKYQSSKTLGTIIIKCICEPFKYSARKWTYNLNTTEIETLKTELNYDYTVHSVAFYFDTWQATGNTIFVINNIPFAVIGKKQEILFPIKIRPILGEPIELTIKGMGTIKLKAIERFI